MKHWSAHTASKQHRTSLQRVKAEDDKAAAKAAKRRKPDSVVLPAPGEQVLYLEAEASDQDARRSKRAKIEGEVAPVNEHAAPSVKLDDELDSFLSSIAGIAEETTSPVASGSTQKTPARKPYKPSQPETQTLYEAAPTLIIPDNENTITAAPTLASNPFAGRLTVDAEGPSLPADTTADADVEEETEAERQARVQREEREEIIDRLEEDARAQSVKRDRQLICYKLADFICFWVRADREDADDRLQSLKVKLEAVKRQRRERLAKKQKQ